MSEGADFPRPDESCRLADGRLAQAAIARWYDVRLRATHGILIALDMESLDRMREVVEQTSSISGVVGYKVGLTVTLRLGLGGAVTGAWRQEPKRKTTTRARVMGYYSEPDSAPAINQGVACIIPTVGRNMPPMTIAPPCKSTVTCRAWGGDSSGHPCRARTPPSAPW
jgi:hypothetical protein